MNEVRMLTIMRRLARPGVKLTMTENVSADVNAAASYTFSGPLKKSERRINIQEQTIREWLADGLIEPDDGDFALTAAGRSWIKRRLCAGDEFAAQHQDRKIRLVEFEGVRRPAVVNDAESPLRWLAKRKDKTGRPMLEPYQIESGERLRADYQFAGLTSKVTSSWNPAASSHSGSSSNDAAAHQDNIMAARQRVVRALGAVGPELAGILVDVCCHLKGLEDAERNEGWPQRSGKVILQLALTRLARHYGLISEDKIGDSLRRKLTHWGMDDYRPQMSTVGSAGP
ncbi:MAG: ATPase [Hyphomicrobiales bacterium]|nr:ATPase [Hyphomicrobiales bacterium]